MAKNERPRELAVLGHLNQVVARVRIVAWVHPRHHAHPWSAGALVLPVGRSPLPPDGRHRVRLEDGVESEALFNSDGRGSSNFLGRGEPPFDRDI